MLNLVSFGRVGCVSSATDTGELCGAHVPHNACAAKHLGERAQLAFRVFQHLSNLVRTSERFGADADPIHKNHLGGVGLE